MLFDGRIADEMSCVLICWFIMTTWLLMMLYQSESDFLDFDQWRTAYSFFYLTLQNIVNNLGMSQKIRDIAQKLINNKKVSIISIISEIWWGFVARCFVLTAHEPVGIIQALNMDAFAAHVPANIMEYI